MKNLVSMTDYVLEQIPKFEKYMISECGELLYKKSYTDKSGHVRKAQEIKVFIGTNGRKKAILTIDGVQKNMSISRLVALTFISNPENKAEVNHKDGNILNDHKDNLEWNTGLENKKHAVENGLTAKGERNGKSVLTLEVVRSIKSDLETELYSNIIIAKRNNTSVYNISDIKNKRTWNY